MKERVCELRLKNIIATHYIIIVGYSSSLNAIPRNGPSPSLKVTNKKNLMRFIKLDV